MVIAPADFRDEEFSETKKALESIKAEVTVVNSTGQASKGMFGTIVKPDKNFYNINVGEYDAIVFVGGSGTAVYHNNRQAISLAKDFYSAGKIVAAICIAPTILVNAGILNGKKATAFPSERDNINAVGTYTGGSVEVDGKIITGNGPQAAKEFGKKIADVLR